MSYNTQMEAARQGVITPQMKNILEEGKNFTGGSARGRCRRPHRNSGNKNHTSLKAKGVGTGLTTKINVNLGVSEDCCNLDLELNKVRRAVDLKADAIMDLSTFGDTETFRKRLVEMCPVMIGTVPGL